MLKSKKHKDWSFSGLSMKILSEKRKPFDLLTVFQNA